MAHYALLNDQNIITQVIVGRNEWEVVDGVSNWETYYGNLYGQKCVRTSYNGNIRKNYAGIGYSYDEARDAFIAPKPFASWILNEETCRWEAPIPYPGDSEAIYTWDEEAGNWVLAQLTI